MFRQIRRPSVGRSSSRTEGTCAQRTQGYEGGGYKLRTIRTVEETEFMGREYNKGGKKTSRGVMKKL